MMRKMLSTVYTRDTSHFPNFFIINSSLKQTENSNWKKSIRVHTMMTEDL